MSIFADPRRVLIVAELSANHNGSLERALQTVRAAADAGADAVKIQTYTADSMTIDCHREDFIVRGGPWNGRSLYSLYEEAHTPWAWHAELKRVADEAGVPLFSTPFAPDTVTRLEELGVPAFKIASFEITDLPLIQAVARTTRPLIISTGMATRAEIGEAVQTVRASWGAEDHGLTLLHCVSAYPADPREMNLATIPDLARAFGVRAGLSDHTTGTAVAVAAVALGASMIEKHFTLDRAGGGLDASFSLEPDELASLVGAVREVEAAIGEVRHGPGPTEAATAKHRRSLYFVRDVARGAIIGEQDVRAIRPGLGLPIKRRPQVIGMRAARDCLRGTPVTEDALGEG